MSSDPSKRIADLIDRLEVKTEAELVTPAYLEALQQQLDALPAPSGHKHVRYDQYAAELQALIYGSQGQDKKALECINAAVQFAGSPRKLRSRLLGTFVRKNPQLIAKPSLAAQTIRSGPGDLSLLTERERKFMREHGLGDTPEIEFLIRKRSTLVTFLILGSGAYPLYWFYKNWQALRDGTGQRLSPFWRTVFIYFTAWRLFTSMTLLAKSRGYKPRYSGGRLAAVYIGLVVTNSLLYLLPVPKPITIVVLAYVIATCTTIGVIVLAEQAASFAVTEQTPEKPKLRPVNYVECVVVLIGLLFAAQDVYLLARQPQLWESGSVWQATIHHGEISNAKQNSALLSREYQQCTVYLQEERASLKPTDKNAVQEYNTGVQECKYVEQLRDKAAEKYKTLSQST